MRRAKRSGFCPPDIAPFNELCDITDDKLFNKINADANHIINSLLSTTTIASQNYNLRSRAHNRRLPKRSGYLTDCNFIVRLLYKDKY